MNWTYIKNILLGMLIVMNVFIISALVFKRVTTENIPPLVSAAAELALENSGISCDSSLIPQKYLTAPRLEAAFPSPMELSLRFFGSQLAFQSDETSLTAHSDKAVLSVSNEYFSYKSGEAAVPAEEKQLRLALKKAGFDLSKGVYSSKYNMFVPYYNNRPLFGMYLTAQLDKDGNICSVQGKWPDITSVSAAETGLSIISRLPDIGNEFNGGGEIEDIRFGYVLTEESTSNAYVFIPAWRVSMADGRSKVFQ